MRIKTTTNSSKIDQSLTTATQEETFTQAEATAKEQINTMINSFCNNLNILLTKDINEAKKYIQKYQMKLMSVKDLTPNHDLCKTLYNLAKRTQENDAKEEAGILYELAMRIAASETEEQTRQMSQVFCEGLNHLSRVNNYEAVERFKTSGIKLKQLKNLMPNHDLAKSLHKFCGVGNHGLLPKILLRLAEDKTVEQCLLQIEVRLYQLAYAVDPDPKYLETETQRVIELLKKIKNEQGTLYTIESITAYIIYTASFLQKAKLSELALSLVENANLTLKIDWLDCPFADYFNNFGEIRYFLEIFIQNNKRSFLFELINLNNLGTDGDQLGEDDYPLVARTARDDEEEVLTALCKLGVDLYKVTGSNENPPYCTALYIAGVHGSLRCFKILLEQKAPLYGECAYLRKDEVPFIHRLIQYALDNLSQTADYWKILQLFTEFHPYERTRVWEDQTAMEYVKQHFPHFLPALYTKLERQIRQLILENTLLKNILCRKVYLPTTFSKKMPADLEKNSDIVTHLFEKLSTLDSLIKSQIYSTVLPEFYAEFVCWVENCKAEASAFYTSPKCEDSKAESLCHLDEDDDALMKPIPAHAEVIQDVDKALSQIRAVCQFITEVSIKLGKTQSGKTEKIPVIDSSSGPAVKTDLKQDAKEKKDGPIAGAASTVGLFAESVAAPAPANADGEQSTTSRKRKDVPTTALEVAQSASKKQHNDQKEEPNANGQPQETSDLTMRGSQ